MMSLSARTLLLPALVSACVSDPGVPASPTTAGALTDRAVPAVERARPRIGMNGEGFFDNLTTWDIGWLQDLDATIVLRIPGGGDSKFAHPRPPTAVKPLKGWGLRQADLDAYFGTYLPGAGASFAMTCDGPPGLVCGSDWCGKTLAEVEDKYADLTEKVARQTACDPAAQLDGMPTCNFLEKVVGLSAQLDLEIVYVANVNAPPTEVYNAIAYLIDNGVQVTAVEMGNESYFPTNFDWDFDCYRDRVVPLADMLRSAWPTLPVSLGAAAFKAGEEAPSADSIVWNDRLADFLASDDNLFEVGGGVRRRATAATVHYYLTEAQCPAAWAARPAYSPGDLDDPGYYEAWNDALGALTTCEAFEGALLEEIASAHERFGPEVAVLVTETNIKVAEDWGGTLAQGGWLFSQLVRGARESFVTLAHNGVANELYGLTSMYRRRVDGNDAVELDGIPTEPEYNVRRVGYWAFDLAQRALEVDAERLPDGPIMLALSGTRSFWYTNYGPTALTPTVIAGPGVTVTVASQYVHGDGLWASAGYAAWNQEYAKTTGVAPRDLVSISGITTDTGATLPPYSFGLVTFDVTKK